MRDGAPILTWPCLLKSSAKTKLSEILTTQNTTERVPNQSTTKFSLTKCSQVKKPTINHWKNTFLCAHKYQPTTKISWTHEELIESCPQGQTVLFRGVWSRYLTQRWRQEAVHNKAKLLWCPRSTKTSLMNFTICQGREKSSNSSLQEKSFLASSIIKAIALLRSQCQNFLSNIRRPSLLIRCRGMLRHLTRHTLISSSIVKSEVMALPASDKWVLTSDFV